MSEKDLLAGLTPEQIKKARNCKSSEELLALAKAEGIELNDDQLAAVSGGCGAPKGDPVCPHCQSKNVSFLHDVRSMSVSEYECLNCGAIFRF